MSQAIRKISPRGLQQRFLDAGVHRQRRGVLLQGLTIPSLVLPQQEHQPTTPMSPSRRSGLKLHQGYQRGDDRANDKAESSRYHNTTRSDIARDEVRPRLPSTNSGELLQRAKRVRRGYRRGGRLEQQRHVLLWNAVRTSLDIAATKCSEGYPRLSRLAGVWGDGVGR